MPRPLTGTMTAIITPFLDNLSVDYKAFEKLLEAQITAGIDGIIVLGTTGESPTISTEETSEIMRFSQKIVAGRTKLIFGTGSNCTEKSITTSQLAAEIGCDGVLVVSPYYNKPTQKGLVAHFSAIAEAVPHIEVIVYQIPGRCNVNISLDSLEKIFAHTNVNTLKEASGDLEQIEATIKRFPEVSVVSGNDDQNAEINALGGQGCISVLSNVLPIETKKIVDLGLQGQHEAALALQQKYLPFIEALFCETNPIPVKTVQAMEGKCAEIFRLPLCTMEERNRKHLEQVWQQVPAF